jgi:flagellar FliL protein
MASEKSGETEESTGSKAPEPKVEKNRLVLIISIVNLVVTSSMLVVLFLSYKKDGERASLIDSTTQSDHGDKKEGGSEAPGSENGERNSSKSGASKSGVRMLSLDLFTVNLSTPGTSSPKFARVNISLELPNEDVESELTQKNPQVRNAIIDLFNSKRPNDLATVEGREYLKEEIKSSLNSFLVGGKVKGVFFTSFSLTS